MIPFEMIEEDLHVARDRARRWDQLAERHRLLETRIEQAQQAADATGITKLEVRRGEESRLSSYYADQRALERELAEVGPAREVYEELLSREERRLIEASDPRAPELAELARRLSGVEAELSAVARARSDAQAQLDDGLPDGGARVVGALAELAVRSTELSRTRDELMARREDLLVG
ncbi:hypothetical protein ACIBG8_20770 [Nonomuraea sp. NPDC050556]|uniref:hypothetical protein n=1 Tax=Nonomuraea sp. NPDC050556 TaxID=3364369 RepID=UPI003796307B